MKPSTLFFGAVGLLSPFATSALELNVDDPGAQPALTSLDSINMVRIYQRSDKSCRCGPERMVHR